MAKDRAICPACDYIVDTSFLSGAAAEEDAESTPTLTPPPEGATQIRPLPQPPRPPKPSPLPSPAHEPEEEDAPGPFASPSTLNVDTFLERPMRAWELTREIFEALSFADRLAFSGAALMALSCFFPWKSTDSEGDILGLASSGFWVFVASIFLLSTLLARVRRAAPRFSESLLWSLQLCSAGFAVFWCAAFLQSASFTPPPPVFGQPLQEASSASLGVYLGLIAATVALGGTLLHVKSGTRPRRH